MSNSPPLIQLTPIHWGKGQGSGAQGHQFELLAPFHPSTRSVFLSFLTLYFFLLYCYRFAGEWSFIIYVEWMQSYKIHFVHKCATSIIACVSKLCQNAVGVTECNSHEISTPTYIMPYQIKMWKGIYVTLRTTVGR